MDNEKIIWDFLIKNGLTEEGAAGLMGNMFAESGLRADNAEDYYMNKLNMTDAQYVSAVDSGVYQNFINDSIGFGLCQWTWWTRKQNLYNFCKKRNQSIAHLNTQLDFLLLELNSSFVQLIKILKETKSIREASDKVLINFEAPADQSQKVKDLRYNYALSIYNRQKGGNLNMSEYKKGQKNQLSKNLVSTEFDCHGVGCCSTTIINPKLVEIIQKIRDYFGKPITITSGYRCTVHNKNVGGATGSRHGKGDAADIVVANVTPREVAKYAESIGVKGIGLYETSSDGYFTHVDTRETKSFWYGQAQAARTTFGGTSNTQNNTQTLTSSNSSSNLIKVGDCNDKVKELQQKLVTLGYSVGNAGIDGAFGNGTLVAVKKFQKDNNLLVDGYVGNETMKAIDNLISAQKKESNYKYKTTASLLNVRQGAGINYPIIARLTQGTECKVLSEQNGWYEIEEPKKGWVSKDYVEKIEV